MEDAHIAELNISEGVSFFGVYDGHGGHEVADYVREHLVPTLKKLESFQKGDYKQALAEVYLEMDKELQTEEGRAELLRY